MTVETFQLDTEPTETFPPALEDALSSLPPNVEYFCLLLDVGNPGLQSGETASNIEPKKAVKLLRDFVDRLEKEIQ